MSSFRMKYLLEIKKGTMNTPVHDALVETIISQNLSRYKYYMKRFEIRIYHRLVYPIRDSSTAAAAALPSAMAHTTSD